MTTTRPAARPARRPRLRRALAAAACLAAVAGPLGVATTASAAPPLQWAVSDGSSLLRGSGTTAFTKLGVGRYEVTFASDVSACAYVATTQRSGSQALTVFTAGGHLSPNGVYVETKNGGGGLSDAPFHLYLGCDATGAAERHAVVGYDGTLARASAGTTLTSLGAGRYQVRFSRNVSTCAYLASVGDPANALVFGPAGVSTSRVSSDPNAVYVETKNPGGGLNAGVPFHLAVVCSDSRLERAVLRADGTPQRGSTLTSGFSSGTGAYTVVTDRDVRQCAWLATRGEAGTAVPFTPTTVEVTPGPAANTVGIDEKTLLALGGTPSSQAVHVVIAC